VIRLPYAVWIDSVFINTLPRIEKISGLAEIVKHAIIASKEMWDILSKVPSPDDIPWDSILEINHPVKLAIVEEDLHEGGKRKILNFGHTIGHALESYFLSSGNDVTHGQSVTLGMLAEAKIANLAGLLNNTDFNAIVNMVERLLEPLRISFPTFDELNFWLLQDKKKSGAVIGYSLPDKIGSCRWDVSVPDNVAIESFHWLKQVMDSPERFRVQD